MTFNLTTDKHFCFDFYFLFCHNRFTNTTFSRCIEVVYYRVSIGITLLAMIRSIIHNTFLHLLVAHEGVLKFICICVACTFCVFFSLLIIKLFHFFYLFQTICSGSNYLTLRSLNFYRSHIVCNSMSHKCCICMRVLFCNLYACVSVQCQCVYV